MKFTKEEKDRWESMLIDTWHAIGSDAEQMMAGTGQRLTRAVIVEFVLDANRVQQYGGMTDEEYEFLGTQYGKSAFQRWARDVLNY